MSRHNRTPPRVLDLRGLACPLPLLKTRKALLEMPSGAELEVLATDPMATRDIPEYAESAGHAVLAVVREGDAWRFRLRHR